jgi:hypothetical protein
MDDISMQQLTAMDQATKMGDSNRPLEITIEFFCFAITLS